MLRHSTVVLGMIAMFALPVGAQRARGNADPPGFKTLLTVDSARIPNIPAVSPDGKWMVFSRAGDGPTSSSIWMAAVKDPKPFRLITGDHADSWPTFSPTGDRIFFLSNRQNRNSGSRATFVMSIPIDKATGSPTGPVQQVTTDSVSYLPPNGISPDGKWLAYTITGAPPLVRLVPTAGGNARTLAAKYTGPSSLTFSADGQKVVFGDSGATMLREVSVTGRAVTALVRLAAGELLMPAANRGDRYVVWPPSDRPAELRDLTGRSLGAAPVPPKGNLICGSTYSARSDGRGVVGVTNSCSGLRRLTIATGVIENVLATTPGALGGGTIDGAIITWQRGAGGVLTITSVSQGGKVDGKVTLGPEIQMVQGGPIQGGKLLLGLGPSYPHKAVLNGYGVDSVLAWHPAYLIDRITGVVRKLADSADYGCCFGPHGWSTGIAEAHGSTVEVKSIDANGATHLIHSFPRATYPHRMFYWGFVNGARLAYLGTGDTSVSVATGPEGSPKPITVALAGGLQWSPDGRKLAVAFFDRQNNHRATVRVFDIATDGSAASTGPALDLGFSGPGDFAGIEWLPDASAVLVQSYTEDANGCMGCIVLRPLNPARPPVRLVPSTGGMVGNYYVESAGKSVLFTQSTRGGASIWTADFLPVKKP